MVLEGAQGFLGLAFQTHECEYHDCEAQLGGIEIGVIPLNNASLFETADAAQTRRRGQTDAIRQFDIGNAPLILQLSQEELVDVVEIDHRPTSLAPIAKISSCETHLHEIDGSQETLLFSSATVPLCNAATDALSTTTNADIAADKPVKQSPDQKHASTGRASGGALMHFDDRLATVMRLPATTGAIARIQYRQLIDLLGQRSMESGASDVALAAMTKLETLAALIPANERAALLSEPTTRIANADLIARLTKAEPEVAIAAIQAADLSEADWLELIPSLEIRARGILRHRDDLGDNVAAVLERLGISDRGLPPADTSPVAVSPEVASSVAQPTAPERPSRPELVVLEGGASGTTGRRNREQPSVAGIGAIVRKIEAFRTARTGEGEANSNTSGPSQVGKAAVSSASIAVTLDFTTDERGRINWADGPFSSGLVGFLLTASKNEAVRQPFLLRQPLRNLSLELPGAPALTGLWRLDALPNFSGGDGRFTGYTGRLRRSPPPAYSPEVATSHTTYSMREVLHELRTPANAIQVAAEIIQQQLFGPAPHEYRALAAAIAGDTAHILAGFDEMDRLVRMESGVLLLSPGECNIGTLVYETVSRLRAWTTPRGSDFSLPDLAPHPDSHLVVGIDKDEVARLMWRLLAAIAGASNSGEMIDIDLRCDGASVITTIGIPPTLSARLNDAAQPGHSPALAKPLSAGIFGVGFTLRLAAAEARAAGGSLLQGETRITLSLPASKASFHQMTQISSS